MKYIITILLACVATIGFSQVEHKARFDNPNGNNILEIVNKNTSFNIIGYDGNEVIIQKFSIGNEDAKRQKGLMAVYPGGFKDNTGIGFSVKQEGSKISVRQLSKRPIKLTVKVPRETKIYISEYSASASNFLDYKVSEIAGEIQIKSNYGDINFDNINGPIVLETRHGSIEGTFNRLSSQGPSSLNSSYGIIDVSLNKDAKVDVILAPRSGQAFTDFDIVHDDSVVEDEKETGLDKNKTSITTEDIKNPQNLAFRTKKDDEGNRYIITLPSGVEKEYKIKGKINGGGTSLKLSTVQSDIYLRRK